MSSSIFPMIITVLTGVMTVIIVGSLLFVLGKRTKEFIVLQREIIEDIRAGKLKEKYEFSLE